MKPEQFIASIREAAIKEQARSGIPASLTIAQAILESGWGKSKLTQEAKNLFGIKGVGPAGTYEIASAEYQSGQRYMKKSQFRRYYDWSESIRDHTELLLKPRYAAVVGASWKEACVAVWKAGYATDPRYPEKLMSIIERYKLYEYDEQEASPMNNSTFLGEITETIAKGLLTKIGVSNTASKKQVRQSAQVEEAKMRREDAEKVIVYLQKAWQAAESQEEKKEIGRLADEVRVAAGMKKMNS